MDEIRSLASQRVNIVVSLLTQEEMGELDLCAEAEYCASSGIEFLSFPINDRDVPPLHSKLQDFIQLLRDRIALGRVVVIHCRAGIGRSAIIAACLMVSPGNPVKTVMSAIARSRGLSVPDTNEQLDWVHKFAEWHTKDTP